MSELVAGLIGGGVGGVLGVLGTGVTAYWGPRKLEQWRERQREQREDGPRKQLLLAMLDNDDFGDGRYLKTLRIVTGTSEDECRRLLIEIGARGVQLKDGEGWALIRRKPLTDR